MTEYLIPDTIAETLQLLTQHNGQARIIAGGTDVLPDIRKGKRAPACLVDVTRIPELTRIEIKNGHGIEGYVEVGAAVTFATLREHPYLQQHVHALVEAASSVGAASIQSVATWCGNLVQAMPAADGAIVAITLDAELRIADRDSARWIPVLETFAGPGRSHIDPTRQLITAIRFPMPAAGWGTAWRRAGRRPSLILPTLNCAVKLVLDKAGNRIARAAIGLGPVASCPHRATEAESYLVGRVPDAATFAEAAQLAERGADPRTSIHRASREYRLAILPALVEDALEEAARRATRGLSERSPSYVPVP
jgi:carbon-monoxide dehydrogenase medium subunit